MDSVRKNYRSLMRRVRAARALWRLNEAARGAFIASIIVLAPVLIGVVTGAGWSVRAALLLAAAAGGGLAAAFLALHPLFRRLSDDDAALFLERSLPDAGNRIISAVQLGREALRGRARFDPAMFESLLGEARRDAVSIPLARAVNRRRTAGAAAGALALLALFSLYALGHPGAWEKAVRFTAPPYVPARETFSLTSVSGNITARRDSDVTIKAVFSGNMRGTPFVEVRRDVLQPLAVRMRAAKSAAPERRAFSAVLRSVTDDLRYRVRYGEFRSREYRVKVVDPPSVRKLKLLLEYPRHTGIPPETILDSGDVRAPFGTKAALEITASAPLKKAWLEFEKGETSDCVLPGGATARASFAVTRSGSYSVRLVDSNGFENPVPPVFFISSIADEPPSIRLIRPDGDARQSRAEPVSIAAEAHDDYGIAAVTLNYSVLGRDVRGTEKINLPPAQNLDFSYSWKLTRIEAYEGDTVEFYLRALDNDELAGPKSAVTETRRVTIVSAREDYRKIEESEEEILSRLESAMRESGYIMESFNELRRETAGALPDTKQRADLERHLLRQERLESEISHIAETMHDVFERMKTNPFIGPDTLDKISQISRLTEELLSDEMKQRLKNIQEALRNLNLSGIDGMLMEAALDQEKLQRSLDLTLKRLKRITAEQKLRAVTGMMKKLVEKQREIVEKTGDLGKRQKADGLPPEDRAGAEKLSLDEARVRENVKDVAGELRALGGTLGETDGTLSEKLSALEKQADGRSLDRELGGSAGELARHDPRQALPHAEKALELMQSLLADLSGFEEEYFAAANRTITNLIREILYGVLNVSNRHEELLAALEKARGAAQYPAGEEDAASLARDTKFLHDSAGKVFRELNAVAAATMAIPPEALENARLVQQRLASAVRLIENRNPGEAFAMSGEAYVALNRLAIELLESGRRARELDARAELEEYLRRLEELAGAQEDLNSMLTNMSETGLPLPSPAGQLRAMALQQSYIREGVRRLLDEMGALGELGKRLDQIEEQMEEVERMLMENRADDDVRRRQSSILRRLRDAALSLKREALEERRVAETGGDYEPQPPGPVYIRGGKALPDDVRIEMESYRGGKYPAGYERPVEKYYEELMK
ncbi:MAG: hypothetical protein AB1742_08850 [bacterium]